MVSIQSLRNRLVGLLDTYKQLESQSQLKADELAKCKLERLKANTRQAALEEAVSKLSERLDSANARTNEAETAAEELSLELAFLEEEANDWKQKGLQLQQQLDMMRMTMQTV
ncbi:hypothetical protein CLF_110794 [Clonorchis sinensis]|uniref:Uncharacterized protein n=1 Tax=Clonorchis sinensis TaxID=79923 RepID=G7YL63_CLOSI|nr:hypothetical protein CLF_110794 [Clonorchis sinensis]